MKITKTLAGTGLLAAVLLTACSSPGSATPTATTTVPGPTKTVEVQVPGPTKTVTKIKTVKVTVPGPTKTVTVVRQAAPAKTLRAPEAPAPAPVAPPASSNALAGLQQSWDGIGPAGRSDACGMYRGDMRAALLESWAEDAPMSVVQQFFASKCN